MMIESTEYKIEYTPLVHYFEAPIIVFGDESDSDFFVFYQEVEEYNINVPGNLRGKDWYHLFFGIINEGEYIVDKLVEHKNLNFVMNTIGNSLSRFLLDKSSTGVIVQGTCDRRKMLCNREIKKISENGGFGNGVSLICGYLGEDGRLIKVHDVYNKDLIYDIFFLVKPQIEIEC